MTQIKEIWNLRIRHDFYRDGNCPGLRLDLSQNSELLLRRRGCRLLQTGVSDWRLITFDADALNDSDQLELDFICENESLVHNTQWDWQANNTCRQIEVGVDSDTHIYMETLPGQRVASKPHVFFRLVVSLRGVNYEKMSVAELTFTAKSLYWEYWLIPRDGNINRKLELEIRCDNTEIGCTQCEDSSNPMNLPLIKLRTVIPLKVQEYGMERVTLYEILPSGIKRPLMRSMPLPVCGRYPFEREDTVVVITYI